MARSVTEHGQQPLQIVELHLTLTARMLTLQGEDFNRDRRHVQSCTELDNKHKIVYKNSTVERGQLSSDQLFSAEADK